MQNVHSDELIGQSGPAFLAPGYWEIKPAPQKGSNHINLLLDVGLPLFFRLGGLITYFTSGVRGGYCYFCANRVPGRPRKLITLIFFESRTFKHLYVHVELERNVFSAKRDDLFAENTENSPKNGNFYAIFQCFYVILFVELCCRVALAR